jgi:hypothetical protein
MRLSELVTHDIIAPATPDEHIAVSVAQTKLRVPVTTRMDAATQAALRGVQRFHGLTAHGILDISTAVILDRMRAPGEIDAQAHPGSAQER